MPPGTRSKNASQHPGQVVLETKQKRRTSEQKQADDAQAEQLRQEQMQARQQGFKRVANVLEQAEQEADDLLANRPKPRPRIKVKGPVDPSESVQQPHDNSGDHAGSSGNLNGAVEGQEVEDNNDTPTQSKRQRMQKTSTRDAVEAARSNPPEIADGGCTTDGQPEKEKPSEVSNQESVKDNVAGVGKVKDWADKLASSNFLQSLPSQRSSSSNSRHARSISTGSGVSLAKQSCTTPASSTRAATLTNDNASEVTSQAVDPYVQGSDQSERQSIPDPSRKAITQRKRTTDVTEVVSDSEPDESALPPSVQDSDEIQSHMNRSEAKESKGKGHKKRTHQSEETNGDSQPEGAPTSKRSKRAPRSTAGSQRAGSGVNKKYVKDDLPSGSTTDNVWRRLFISTLAHFAGGYNNPWSIPSDKLNSTLQLIWNTVYKGKIEHTIVVNGPVFQIAKQGLNTWRSGFAAAAIVVVANFFASDSEFTDPAQRIEFASAMLRHDRFLFRDNRGTAWAGLWRGSFVLPTFAHHFNFIQGCVAIAALDKELTGPRAALALACAAVGRVLTLVANNNITFKSGKLDNAWTAVIAKGNQYEFNESVWGQATRRYLDPIQGLDQKDFALIVEDTQNYVKKLSQTISAASSDNEDSDYDNLFSFR